MERSIAEALLNVLEARRGIIAVVGAGGKKTTLSRLLEAHCALGTKGIALTTTVQMAPPSMIANMTGCIAEAEEIVAKVGSLQRNDEAQRSDGAALIAAPSAKPNRLAGLPPDLIGPIHETGRFNVSLVKADGARMRLIKAPSDHEPALPTGTTTLLPIVSARAFGKPLSPRLAHRAERLSAVIDAPLDTILAPIHIARLLSHRNGALRAAGDAKIVPIINMADAQDRLDASIEAARLALALTDRFDQVVVASMTEKAPVLEVISQQP
ncbi:MAG: selenium cofactor biosynthesis protein YqeC [Geminicoccaceae bacterium]